MARKKNYSKTVYILGAGFSAPAGGPNQNKIMEYMIELPGEAKIPKRRNQLLKFLTDDLNIPKEKVKDLSLERTTFKCSGIQRA